MDLATTHLHLQDDEDAYRSSKFIETASVIPQLFERLTTLSNQLKSAVELPSLLQA